MGEFTIHTGCQNDETTLHISWHDHNNVLREFDIDITVLAQDKPRTVEVRVNGDLVARHVAGQPVRTLEDELLEVSEMLTQRLLEWNTHGGMR